MERGDRREVGFEGRLSVVNRRGQGNNEESDQAKNCGVSSDLEWVCCCGQGHQEAKSPETTEQMQRKRTGPRAPRAGRSEGKSGETT